jgi:hypothetical protein
MKFVQTVPQGHVGFWIEVAVAVQSEADRGVTGASGNLLWGSARRDPERYGGMA